MLQQSGDALRILNDFRNKMKELNIFISETEIRNWYNLYTKSDLSTKEFFLPDVVDGVIRNNEGSVSVLSTTATWYGVTYREDLDAVKSAVNNYIKEGIYKENLW